MLGLLTKDRERLVARLTAIHMYIAIKISLARACVCVLNASGLPFIPPTITQTSAMLGLVTRDRERLGARLTVI